MKLYYLVNVKPRCEKNKVENRCEKQNKLKPNFFSGEIRRNYDVVVSGPQSDVSEEWRHSSTSAVQQKADHQRCSSKPKFRGKLDDPYKWIAAGSRPIKWPGSVESQEASSEKA